MKITERERQFSLKYSGGKAVRGINHPPPSSAEVKERVELYLYSPFWP